MFDSAFLNYIVDPRSGLTVGETIIPQLRGLMRPSLEAGPPPLELPAAE